MLVGAQLGGERRGQIVPGEGVQLEQRVHLAPPGLCLFGDDTERGELGPECRLIAADPQRRCRCVREFAGLLDQRAQRLQPGIVEREVGAVVEQDVRLA